MAKRSTKRQRSYDEDEFSENEIMEDLEDEDEEFDDDYEDSDDAEDEEDEEEEEEETGRRPKRASKKKAASSRKHPEPVAGKEVRLKAFWTVYSQSFQKVETFEYGEKAAAEKRAAELTEAKKLPHFVKLDKKVIES